MTELSSPADGRVVSVTIKYDKGHDASWAVFKGLIHEVRADLVEFFGLDSESVAGLTLSEVVVNVTQLAHGKGVVATKLGGVAVGSSSEEPAAWRESASAAEPAADQPHPMLARISGASTVDELQRLWAENQAAFAEADVMAAYKAKGKALSTGATA